MQNSVGSQANDKQPQNGVVCDHPSEKQLQGFIDESLEMNKRLQQIKSVVQTTTSNIEGRLVSLAEKLEQIKKDDQTQERCGLVSAQYDEASLRLDALETLHRGVAEETGMALLQVDRVQGKLEQCNHVFAPCDKILEEFDRRLLTLESGSTDNGVLVWKIDRFASRLAEAKTGVNTSFCSPPMTVGRFGYQLCLRAYLNGDGAAQGSFLSVYLVVMRGQFDAVLSWPFAQKVTIMLLDQSPARCHVRETFLPDPSSTSYHRPTSDKNLGSGCPRFASHELIRTRGYCQDDHLFLKLAVDGTGLHF